VPPPLRELTWSRHLSLVEGLRKISTAKGWDITWHGAWHFHRNLAISWGDEEAWMRYPAISFVAAAHPFTTPRS
jgi:hypothetical protein